jgi:hypothetical protein
MAEDRLKQLEAQLVKDRVMFENLYGHADLATDWRLHCHLRVTEINALIGENKLHD